MNKPDWKSVAELIGIASIVASLIFVGLQVRQDQLLARATLGAGTSERSESIALLMANDDFAETYAKSLERPEELTLEESVELSGFYWLLSNIMIRECYLMQRGVFEECGYVLSAIIDPYFGNSYAKSWWAQYKPPTGGIYPLPSWVDDEIRKIDEDRTRDNLSKVLDGQK